MSHVIGLIGRIASMTGIKRAHPQNLYTLTGPGDNQMFVVSRRRIGKTQPITSI
jgi:hypothetical protein